MKCYEDEIVPTLHNYATPNMALTFQPKERWDDSTFGKHERDFLVDKATLKNSFTGTTTMYITTTMQWFENLAEEPVEMGNNKEKMLRGFAYKDVHHLLKLIYQQMALGKWGIKIT